MERNEMYKMIAQVPKYILKVHLGQGGAEILDKSDLKIRTIEPDLDFPGSYKTKIMHT